MQAVVFDGTDRYPAPSDVPATGVCGPVETREPSTVRRQAIAHLVSLRKRGNAPLAAPAARDGERLG
jgi:hypothetical protein